MDGTTRDAETGGTMPRQPVLSQSPAMASLSATALATAASSSAASGATQPDAHPFPVLVAETDRGIRALLSQVLTLEGYDVAVVASGPECLDYLAHHRSPHILSVGIFFDETGDIRILSYLRGHPALRKRLGVIVNGAYFNLRRYGRRYAQFIAATIPMPFSPTQVIAAFNRAETKLSARLDQPHE